jgi:Flp pilus assembly pilin Flp
VHQAFSNQKGAVLAEYALAAGLILIVCIIAGGFLITAFRQREYASYQAISSPVTCLANDRDSDDCK